MNTLGDALKDAYVSDERRGRGLARGPHRTITAIRRRRTARAAGTGTAAVFGVAALGGIWWLGPGGRFAEPASPALAATCTTSIYAPPNLAARGDVSFALRAYVDLRKDSPDPKVVAVLADGTATEVLPDAAGDYIFVHEGKQYMLVMHNMDDMDPEFFEKPIVFDYDDWGNADFLDWDGESPHTHDYKWTTVVPTHVPDGIDTEELSMTLARTTLGSGLGYIADSVPEGAYTDLIVTTAKGDQVIRLKEGDTSLGIEGPTDVESVALRVGGLPGGETFTIVATYNPDGAPPPVCAPGDHGLTTATSSPWVQEPETSSSPGSEEPLPPGVSEVPVPESSESAAPLASQDVESLLRSGSPSPSATPAP